MNCKVCGNRPYRRRLCRPCYKRDQQQKFHCTFKKCTSPVFATTLCQKHYRVWRTTCLQCNKLIHCRSLCRSHYRKAIRNNDFPKEPICDRVDCNKPVYLNRTCIEHFKEQFKVCIVVECSDRSHKRGLCCKHYFRQRRRDQLV